MFHSHNIECSEFRPLQDWVILAPIKEKLERTKHGIVIPEETKQTGYGRCEVVAVGPGRTTTHGVLVPNELKPGQFVGLQKFVTGEMEFGLNGRRVFAIRERHLNVTME